MVHCSSRNMNRQFAGFQKMAQHSLKRFFSHVVLLNKLLNNLSSNNCINDKFG